MPGRTFFIGIDDTDFGESIGTGALARELQLRLASRFGAQAMGITRHQFLVHPDIPYTSHNSAACVVVSWDMDALRPGVLRGSAAARHALPPALGVSISPATRAESRFQAASGGGSSRKPCVIGSPVDAGAVADACEELLRALPHEGADPGLCVRVEGDLTPEALAFARRAQTEVVRKDEALELARREGAFLRELGGAGIGVIGAFSACALRMSGDDGRFLSLGGIRELKSDATAGEIMGRCPIERVIDESGAEVPMNAVIRTNGWVRPVLSGGKVVLVVKKNGGGYFIENRKRQEEG